VAAVLVVPFTPAGLPVLLAGGVAVLVGGLLGRGDVDPEVVAR
jgi:hypothetical protein